MSDRMREASGADAELEGDEEEVREEGEGPRSARARPREDAAGPEETPERSEEREAEMELGEAMDALQGEFESLNDRHLRLAAEFQNYRRRAESEMGEAWTRAQSDLIRRFLDALDDLQRVALLDPADESVSVQSIVEGVDLVERKFLRALEEAGVEVLRPEGERFDPETMEAMLRVPTEAEEEDERVHEVFQDGYLMKGYLVRPARVSVKKRE